jgi:uncharacterized protein DUF4440
MQRLKIALGIALVLILCGCAAGHPPQSQQWKEATGAEAHERLWWKAVQEHDFLTAERRLAPIFTLVTATGIADREKAVQYFRSLDLASIDLADVQVQPEGDDLVISYVATMQTKASAAPERYYMVTVWQHVKRGWIAIEHSETPAGNP